MLLSSQKVVRVEERELCHRRNDQNFGGDVEEMRRRDVKKLDMRRNHLRKAV